MYTASSTQSGRMGIFLISMLCSRHWNTKGPWYSEGFVSTMNILACVCSTIRRGGWANAGESPGLSCCCTSPPQRDPHFPCTANFLSCFPFWRKPWGIKATELRKKRQWASRLLPSVLLFLDPSPFFSVIPSAYWWRGRGAYSVGAHVIWRVKQAKSMYSPTLLHCYNVQTVQ